MSKDASSPKRRPLGRRGLWIIMTILAGLLAAALAFEFWRWATVPPDAPVIGVSLDTTWIGQLGITRRTYETALARVDAKVLYLKSGAQPVNEILDAIDGLLLTGGGDVHPELAGTPAGGAERVDRQRDEFELALIAGALERDMPVLGICRGIQILNVAHGGTLRNLRDHPELAERHGVDLDSFEAHAVDLLADTKLAAILGAGERLINSFHFQAVTQAAAPLRVSAVAPDGVIEAVERPDRQFVIGLQWHPEILSLQDADALAIFEELVRQAKAYRIRSR